MSEDDEGFFGFAPIPLSVVETDYQLFHDWVRREMYRSLVVPPELMPTPDIWTWQQAIDHQLALRSEPASQSTALVRIERESRNERR